MFWCLTQFEVTDVPSVPCLQGEEQEAAQRLRSLERAMGHVARVADRLSKGMRPAVMLQACFLLRLNGMTCNGQVRLVCLFPMAPGQLTWGTHVSD